MNDTNTGGSAFPICVLGETLKGQEGMTLRDYFAAKAMQAAISGHIAHYGHDDYFYSVKTIASYSYEMADAMLKARSAQ